MQFLAATAVSLLVGAASLAQATAEGKQKSCPTVTSTATVCSTCVVKKCLAYETISLRPDCPSPVPTSTTSYPCEASQCPEGCASTSYVTVTPTPTPTPTPTSTPCPTVTSTDTICSTCLRPACIKFSTISCRKGCPMPVPTVHTGYPCGERCPGGCDTGYVFKTSGCGYGKIPRPTPTP